MTAVDSQPAAPGGRGPKLSEAKRALLEQRLRRSAARPRPGIPRRPDGQQPPLSYSQERIWFMEQFAPGTAAYGVPLQLTLGPDADLAAFARALRALAARHESLRMRFPADADGRPSVLVGPPADVPVEVLDTTAGDAAAVVQASALRPFDLAAGPLLRVTVVRVDGGAEHLAIVDLHHIVTDGWSNDVLLTELAALYRAERDGGPADLAEPVRYGDFAGWQREQAEAPGARPHLDYWLDRLAALPALDLPTDAPRPPTQRFDGGSHWFVLDRGTVEALTELGRQHRATLFMTLLAGYQALLARYSGQQDFAVGTPVAGRGHPDLDGVVGMFNNMLPLRADLAGDPTGAELLGRVRDGVLAALAHQTVPFEKVINELGVVRDVSRSALFQAMLVLQNYEIRAGDTGLPWTPVHLPATRFELELHAYATGDGGLQCRFVFSTALFEEATVARLAGALRALLADLVARPQARVGELELLDAAARAELAGWNATAVPDRPDATLPGLLAEQAARTPDAVAAVDEHGPVTYGELHRAANRVGHRLRAAGIGPGSVVAVCAERSTHLVTALLGVLKSGAAYLPLDAEHPVDRIAFMLSDAGAAAVLAQRSLLGRLPAGTAGLLVLDDDGTWAGQPDTEPARTDPAAAAGPGDPAYLIYTSGSTGRPKGVLNAHRGVVNRLDWMQARFGLGPDDVVLQKTPAGFDVSVWEFFWPLLTGARLVLAKPGGHRDPAHLRSVIDEHGVTTVHFVPSMLTAFLADEGEPDSCRSLRRVVCSGEELPAEAARRCLAALPWASLHNLYGPTEAAIDVTAWDCTPDALAGRSRVPIGSPIDNVRIHVLDARGREVPVGMVGELVIGGVQVALGYHRRPALTAQRFTPDPLGPPGARRYATGDSARRRADGTVEFLGRIDGQVKLRGLRIELGEIEVVLRDQPGVADAAAAVRETSPGDARIVAYVVGAEPDAAALREALKRRLPDYMVPAAFVGLDALPLSANGKLDRKALPTPAPVTAAPGGAEPDTDAEREIAAIWCEVLGLDRVGVTDDFFALGGHSLLATQVVARMRRMTEGTGRQVGVMDLFGQPTVRGLAGLVEDPDAASRPRRLLYELTRPVPAAQRVRSYVCVPYGGGSAVVYQPLADALPAGHSLFSVAIPGHDVGLDEDSVPFAELARRCADEVLERVDGPLVLYGHCGVGGALIVELARLLEADGREIERVYTGGVFPFAKPAGRLSRVHEWLEDRGSNRLQANWLKSMGVDMSELDPAQADRIIRNMRRDSKDAEEHFTELLATDPARLRAPIVSVVGERDPITDYYQERYREWHFLTDTAAVVVLAEAGHFFLKYRAADLAEILTRTPEELEEQPAGERWSVAGVSRSGDGADRGAPAEPSMRRFALVSAGQLISLAGSALTGWAIPVWIYTSTGSLASFGLTGVFAIVPILLATPLAGAVADRYDRRRVIVVSSVVSAAVVLGFALLLLRGQPRLWWVFGVVWLLSSAGTFQRIAYTAAIPQLVPKRYLGHANGIAQLVNGVALLFVPLLAAGLLGAIGLRGILLVDLASYAFALAVLGALRFPNLMGHLRKETFGQALLGGLRLSWGTPQFRAMLVFFGVSNLLYAVPVLLVTPLVLAFGSMRDVGTIALAEGLGALLGGLAMTVWGGPVRRRMVVNIVAIAVSGACVVLTGTHAGLPVVFAGVFGTALSLALANGIYMTIIQTKVPQRFHGRVIALNQTLTWSTLPIGFAVLLPATGALEPLLAPDGALAGTVGRVIGTGEGRGLGLGYLLFGLGMLLNALIALRVRRLSRLDSDLPDALPDDLVGVQVLADRAPTPAGGTGAAGGSGGSGGPDSGAAAGASRPPATVGAAGD